MSGCRMRASRNASVGSSAFSSWNSRSSSLTVVAEFDDFAAAFAVEADALVAVLAEDQRLAVFEVDARCRLHVSLSVAYSNTPR